MAEGSECGVTEAGITEMDAAQQRKAFKSLSATRRGKLSHCTRKMNEIKTMMKEGADVDNINEGANEFLRLLDEFKRCHESVQKLLPEDVRMNETLDWYEPKMADYDAFLTEVGQWIKTQPDPQALVDVGDSVSQTGSKGSKGSKSSKSSSVASARMKATADKAALQARAEALERKHELEMEKYRLGLKMESLNLETDIAAADARLKALEEFESDEASESGKEMEEQINASEKIEGSLAELEFARIGTIPKTPLQKMIHIQCPPLTGITKRSEQPPRATTNPHIPRVVVSDRPHRGESTPRSEMAQSSDLTNIIQRQTDLADLLVTQQKESKLPRREVLVFGGDPLTFRPFMKAFKHNIEDKTNSSEDRLYFLEQYTVGQPKELVQSCFHMNATTGYEEAKRLLKYHFGDDFKVTSAYVEKALNWNQIRTDDGKALQSYALYLRGCGNAVQDLPYMSELDLPSNMKRLVSKLPFKLREKWRSAVCDITERTQQRPKFHDLVLFMEKQARIIQDPIFGDIQDPAGSINGRKSKRDLPYIRSSSKKSFAVTVVPKTESKNIDTRKKADRPESIRAAMDAFVKPCAFCKGDHVMETCEAIAKIPHKDKIELLKKNGLCFACLVRGHMSKECKKRLTCHSCEKKHPTVLHIENFTPATKQDSDTRSDCIAKVSAAAQIAMVSSAAQTGDRTTSYKLAVVPVKIKAHKGSCLIETYAFLDPGSNATFVTEKLMEQLSVRGKKTEILLRTMGHEKPVKTHVMRGLEVCSLDGNSFIELPEVFTQNAIPVSQENIPTETDIKGWPYLKDVHLRPIKAEVGLLIGANVPKAMEPLKVINSQGEGPYAVLTSLGWTINGPLGSTAPTDEHGRPRIMSNKISVVKLEELLVRQYNQDFSELAYNEKQENSFEDKKFLHVMNSSVKRKDGHYEIRLPFRQDNISLPNNRKVAEQRALSLARRLHKDEAFRKDYNGFMRDVLRKGHAERVPEEQLPRKDGRLWYIPHHGVYHKRKKTIRVVFDCTSSFQGSSLNSELLQGPDLTNTLLGVLLRFRQEPVAVMGDIEGMFHQVRIPKHDVDFLRFLWWPDGDTNQPLAEYRMTVHLFGAVSSPSCANFALKRTADDNEGNCSIEILNTIRRNFYVDDCLKSVPSESQAICLVKELKAVCATGGFKLTKWTSNSRAVLASVPAEERAKEVKDLDLDKDKLPMESALGMRWDTESDMFFFLITPKQPAITRRSILSVLNSVYDPLGFLAPVMLTGKGILQDLYRLNCGWDESIPTAYIDKWKEWLKDLNLISSLRIRRCLKPPNFEVTEAQIHHFCDASERGYGTVSYLKLTKDDGLPHIAFVIGKARVAPLKVVTIPRLELASAVLAARIDRMLKRELELILGDSVFWTDSTAVLKYIQNDARRFQTYVANRVSTIRDLTHKSQWRHIRTGLNPADSASRGMKAKTFLHEGHWLRGPDFLMQPETDWPVIQVPPTLSDSDPEVKKVAVAFTTSALQNQSPLTRFIEHFSSWDKLIRSAAWLLKIKENLRQLNLKKKMSDSDPTGSQLSVEDLTKAEKSLVSYVQQQSFRDEMTSLQKGLPIKKSSRMYKLDPILQHGILRVGGRLSKLAMPEETKHPAILPKDNHLSKILLHHTHALVGHCGRNQMIAKLRTKYWIIRANSAARRITQDCILCRRWHGTAMTQKMSDLPLHRITPDLPPFTHTGLDYFGPIEVKRGRSKVKRYGALFTCLASRAVHLEMAYSMDTDSCISALRRFICRRGQVKEIVSDNGTNFVGTERELREALTHLNLSKIQHLIHAEGIKWTFNPPYGPHHGGVWERLIRIIKKILYSITREQTLDDESLQTALCEVEAIMNDRPITVLSQDVKDPEPLTPNHLLQMKRRPTLPPGLFDKSDTYSRRRWKQTQYMADLFWKRWTREYLPLLQERQKWNKVKKNLKHGDIVLIIDESSPRNSWPMGRITEIFPDKKGHIRRVKIKTQNGTLERPITKLCLLQDMT